jgi:hypothetical protein
MSVPEQLTYALSFLLVALLTFVIFSNNGGPDATA